MPSPFKKSPRSPLHYFDSLALEPQGAVPPRSDDYEPAVVPASPIKSEKESPKESPKEELEEVTLSEVPTKAKPSDTVTAEEQNQQTTNRFLLVCVLILIVVVGVLLGVFLRDPGDPIPQVVSPKLCEEALLVQSNETLYGTNEGALKLSDDSLCSPLSENGPGVWFKLQGDGQVYTASTCHESTVFDTQISVFEGSCSKLTCVTANDQSIGEDCGGSKSKVEWTTNPDETYYIYVHGKRGEEGEFTLTVDSVPQENEFCDDADTVEPSGLYEIIGNTWFAGLNPNATNFTCSESEAPGLWYGFKGTNKTITISTCSESTKYDAQVSVAEGSLCSDLACIDLFDESCPLRYGVTKSFYGLVGEEYRVLVHGAEDESDLRMLQESKPSDSQFGLIIQDGIPPGEFWINPVEACEKAAEIEIDSPLLVTDTLYQSSSPLWNPLCSGSGQGVFFRVVGEGVPVIADTCNDNTEIDTTLTILEGNCSTQELSCIEYNDQGCGDKSSVKWTAEFGQTYYILVRSNGGGQGNFGITVSTAPTPVPSASPSVSPSAMPSITPTAYPTMTPSIEPTNEPSIEPSSSPSSKPSVSPTALPSAVPSKEPTDVPSKAPSGMPTKSPSISPTKTPTTSPSHSPSYVPSINPTKSPTEKPSVAPSLSPNAAPTLLPSSIPTAFPTKTPSNAPTGSPSMTPSTGRPSITPTDSPTTTFAPTYLVDPVNLCEAAREIRALGSIDQVFINPYPPLKFGTPPNSIVGETCGGFSNQATYDGGPALWYKVEDTFDSETTVVAEAQNCNVPGSPLQVTVYSGDCTNPQCVTGTSDFCNSRVSWRWNIGFDSYYIMFHGYDPDKVVSFSFSVGS